MKKKNNKGFSLVELIIVIAIMAVLMIILTPTLLRYVEKCRAQKDDSLVAEVIETVNHALVIDEINAKVKEGDTVSCANGSITSSCDELGEEIRKTIANDSFKFSSKARINDTYTIKIVTGPDGVSLKAESYDDSHW